MYTKLILIPHGCTNSLSFSLYPVYFLFLRGGGGIRARPPSTATAYSWRKKKTKKKTHYTRHTRNTCFRPLSFVSWLPPLASFFGFYAAAAAAVPFFSLLSPWRFAGETIHPLGTALNKLQSTSSRGASSNTPGPPTDADDAYTKKQQPTVVFSTLFCT